MLGKVKKWLGIEGVKLELVLDESYSDSKGIIEGKIKFSSMNDQTVSGIKILLIEKYSRGRRKNKRIDEYKLAETYIDQVIEVYKEEVTEIDFQLEFKRIGSEMDEMEKQFFMKPFIKAAKLIKGVRSNYMVIAEADVEGTKLNPFDEVEVEITA